MSERCIQDLLMLLFLPSCPYKPVISPDSYGRAFQPQHKEHKLQKQQLASFTHLKLNIPLEPVGTTATKAWASNLGVITVSVRRLWVELFLPSMQSFLKCSTTKNLSLHAKGLYTPVMRKTCLFEGELNTPQNQKNKFHIKQWWLSAKCALTLYGYAVLLAE